MGELPHRQRPSVIHLHAQPSLQVLLTGVICNTLESWQGFPNQDQDMQESKCVELLRRCTLPGPTRDLPRRRGRRPKPRRPRSKGLQLQLVHGDLLNRQSTLGSRPGKKNIKTTICYMHYIYKHDGNKYYINIIHLERHTLRTRSSMVFSIPKTCPPRPRRAEPLRPPGETPSGAPRFHQVCQGRASSSWRVHPPPRTGPRREPSDRSHSSG